MKSSVQLHPLKTHVRMEKQLFEDELPVKNMVFSIVMLVSGCNIFGCEDPSLLGALTHQRSNNASVASFQNVQMPFGLIISDSLEV